MTKMDLITGDFNKGSRRSLCHGKNTWFLIFCTLSVVHYFGPEHSEGNSLLWHTFYDRVFKIDNKQDIRNTTVNPGLYSSPDWYKTDPLQGSISVTEVECSVWRASPLWYTGWTEMSRPCLWKVFFSFSFCSWVQIGFLWIISNYT